MAMNGGDFTVLHLSPSGTSRGFGGTGPDGFSRWSDFLPKIELVVYWPVV